MGLQLVVRRKLLMIPYGLTFVKDISHRGPPQPSSQRQVMTVPFIRLTQCPPLAQGGRPSRLSSSMQASTFSSQCSPLHPTSQLTHSAKFLFTPTALHVPLWRQMCSLHGSKPTSHLSPQSWVEK